MGLETGLLIGSMALGAGSAAYSARQQKKAQDRAEEAARDAARRSQTQTGQIVDQFRSARNARRARSFDPVMGALTPGGAGDLLGS